MVPGRPSLPEDSVGALSTTLIFTGEGEEYSAEIAVTKGENPGFREGGAKN